MLKRSLKRRIQKLRSRQMGNAYKKKKIHWNLVLWLVTVAGFFVIREMDERKEKAEQEVIGIQVLAEKENQEAAGYLEVLESGGAGKVETTETEDDYLEVSYIAGNAPQQMEESLFSELFPQDLFGFTKLVQERYSMADLQSLDYLINHFYIVDSSTIATAEEFDVEAFIEKDLRMEKTSEPQILIYHTHGSEAYADSRPNMAEDSVIGVGKLLAEELQETYGYEVIHHVEYFDRKADGSGDRDNAYNNSLPVITALLEKYPSIEVVIDLHRDSGAARVAEVDGVRMAKIMLFNGLCRTKSGPITYYSNPHLEMNLAFSFQMNVVGNAMYPGLMHRIYLKSYRYNMHLAEKYLLIELGTEQNTLQEAKNSMKPLAAILNQVLSVR